MTSNDVNVVTSASKVTILTSAIDANAMTSSSGMEIMMSASDAEMEAAFKRCRYVTEVPGVDTQTVIKDYDRFADYYDKVSGHYILVI